MRRRGEGQSIPPIPPANSESYPGNEDEQSMREMMKNVDAMLHTLNASMATMENAASSHIVYTAPPDDCTMQTIDQVGALPALTAVETHTSLPEVSDAVRA